MQTWIVTGASRGLGRAISLHLAARGHRVLAIAREVQRLQALTNTHETGLVLPCPLDLADAGGLNAGIQALLQQHPHIDGLINNAGIGAYRPLIEHSAVELRDIIQINLTASIQLCHAVLPGMLQRRRGHIVNIGSDLGRRPLANMAAYVASKHGLTGFSHSLLREVKDAGVRVSLINPGIIDTDFGGGAEGSRDPHGSLHPDALAGLVMQVIEQSGSMVVDEVSVHPLGQSDF
ncbi:MAG: SDR family oxidoreductase [Pseudomarimonas sp.]